MSYILDALKKSEEERGHGSAPGVQTMHNSGLSYNTSKTHLWPYILLAAVFINAAALLYFIIARNDAESSAINPPPTTENIVATAAQTVAERTSTIAVETGADEEVYKPISLPNRSETATARATTSAAPQADSGFKEVLEMEELPYDTLQHIPSMDFSAHVYSSNPLQRSLVINGRFMEEGDSIAADVYLNEITPDGAIFEYQGQLFSQRVVSTWN